jgi:type IV pilus assembly protein PilF
MTRARVVASALVAPALAALALVACETEPVGPDVNEKNAAEYNVQLGYAYLQQGDLNLAKEKLERAEKQAPDNPRVHSALGMLYERLGDRKSAKSQYAEALRLAPQDPDIQNNYAVFLCRTGDVDDGVAMFERAARNPLYRTPEAAWTNAGVCLRGAKRNAEAQKAFETAIMVRPNFAEASFQLGDLLFAEGRYAEARSVVDTYLGSFKPTAGLLWLGVQITRKTGDRLAEEKFARRLRVDFPESPEARSLSASPRPSP